MNKIIKSEINTDLSNKRLLDVSEACYYLGIGRNSALIFLKSIGAERRIGRRCLYDRKVIDAHYDHQIEA